MQGLGVRVEASVANDFVILKIWGLGLGFQARNLGLGIWGLGCGIWGVGGGPAVVGFGVWGLRFGLARSLSVR